MTSATTDGTTQTTRTTQSTQTKQSKQTTGGRLGVELELDDLSFDDRGLIPVVCQDVFTGTLLMVAWADRDAVAATERTRRAHFFSRSRQASWRKGETSGNELVVHEVHADCDRDTLLYRVAPLGPTCHTGLRSCFDAESHAVASGLELGWLRAVVRERTSADADSSYTARLLERGVGRVAQKVGEEGVETALAAVATANAQDPDEQASARADLVGELADLFFHSLVLMQACGLDAEEIARELQRRHVGAPQESGEGR